MQLYYSIDIYDWDWLRHIHCLKNEKGKKQTRLTILMNMMNILLQLKFCSPYSLLFSDSYYFARIKQNYILEKKKYLNGVIHYIRIFFFFFFLHVTVSFYLLTWLRVRAFFHKTVRVCHVYCNFKIGCTCRITVIFGTLKDGSLLIITLAPSICFSYRNIFQNGVDALPKIVDAFLSKSSNFHLVRIIR